MDTITALRKTIRWTTTTAMLLIGLGVLDVVFGGASLFTESRQVDDPRAASWGAIVQGGVLIAWGVWGMTRSPKIAAMDELAEQQRATAEGSTTSPSPTAQG
ncbi:hypothetical protein [Naasia lichenicola]|uniref:Uncharacterized protein n=1 Tax=Naasia lichenicola TaxID=2565933 RepID=A0A4S4FMY6_9MICO|nr:hypothetical protein [Naasia lichenicola]THG31554.1 hypothetical protein E6C64_05615 [Naasia lichenicola]